MNTVNEILRNPEAPWYVKAILLAFVIGIVVLFVQGFKLFGLWWFAFLWGFISIPNYIRQYIKFKKIYRGEREISKDDWEYDQYMEWYTATKRNEFRKLIK